MGKKCIPSLSYINLNMIFHNWMMKKFDFLEVRLYGKLCVNVHFVVMKNTSCTIRLLAKLAFLARASNQTRQDNNGD